jgi:hypothetical protein
MSVLSYLQARASDAVLTEQEKLSIDRLIGNLQQKLEIYFDQDLSKHFRFGSTTRGTNLPRSLDEFTDVDYMIVFSDSDKSPQTYLDRLRRFVETNYPRSAVRQDHPTIGLELSHIKFDVVPAVENWWSGLQIPDRGGSWQSTDPSTFNRELTDRNSQCHNQLKPAIRLIKCWNATNDYVFDSYMLEKWIVGNFYWDCSNLRDYVFEIVGDMALQGASYETATASRAQSSASTRSERWKRLRTSCARSRKSHD